MQGRGALTLISGGAALLAAVLFDHHAQAQEPISNAEVGIVKLFSSTYDRRGRNTKIGTGTGFVVSDQGHIATNHHVIDGKGGVLYVAPDGASVRREALATANAEVIWSNPDFDLAIVRVFNPEGYTPTVLAEVLPKKGEPVFAVGYPSLAEEKDIQMPLLRIDATVTSGVLSRAGPGTWGDGGKPVRQIQHSADVSWGNSGGPLRDECGRVIGVNTQISIRMFSRTSATVVPGVNFASNISELIDVMNSLGIEYNSEASRCTPSAIQNQNDLDDMRVVFQRALLAGSAALAVIILTGVLLLRRPRERVVQVIESYSRKVLRSGQRGNASGNAPGDDNAIRAGGAVPERQTPPPGRPSSQRDFELCYAAGRKPPIIMTSNDLATGVTIGRDADYNIDDDSVSRRHATLRAQGGQLSIKDEHSLNGTAINGRQIPAGGVVKLRRGDRVKLGRVELKVA